MNAEFNYIDGADIVKKLYTSDNKMFITKGREIQIMVDGLIQMK
ncbi:hypothetical protein [Clostridium magnum]|nr:hypothetical protein [Clostridium magnum]